MIWHKLYEEKHGDKTQYVMAASCDEGIGIIAAWELKGWGWRVFAMDTESPEWKKIVDFGEGQCIPEEPPTEFCNKEGAEG